MKYILAAVIFISIPAFAFETDQTVNTRFGTVQLIDNKDGTNIDIKLNGKNISSVEANTFNGINEEPFNLGEKDVFAISTNAGGGCGAYYFLTVENKSNATLSPSFSSCGEIFFKKSGNSIITKSMDSRGKNRKTIKYSNGTVTENGKVLK